MKRNTILFLAVFMLVFALVLTACPTSLGNDNDNGNGTSNGNGDDNGISESEPAAVNKASLEAGITAAEADKALVTVSADGNDIVVGKDWVIQDVMDAFTAAIDAAKAVKDSAAATQADVNAALGALNAARTVFNDTKAPGNKTSGFTVAELAELITAASPVLEGAVISANGDGSDVSPSVQWVSAAIWNALDTAINNANSITEGSSQGDKDAAYNALNTAKNNFNSAKSPGTKAVALSGKTYFEQTTKVVFSTTTTSSGTFTVSQAERDGSGNYILTGGKYTYKNAGSGTYTVNEGNSTVIYTPTEVQWYSGSGYTWTVVNETGFRAGIQAMMDEYRDLYGQDVLNALLEEMGFSNVSQYIDYYVGEEFGVMSMGYSFSGDGAALFLDVPLPASMGTNDLNGRTLTRINYSSGWTVEFAGNSYTIKNGGSSVEYGAYSLSTGVDGDGFRGVLLKAESINGNDRADYYGSLSYGDSGNYEDINARKAGETNRRFSVYNGWYKLNGGTGEIKLSN
ncbi:MAG: hypothetical protein LBK83_08020 [Treponema sp.]|jgi:hypothetical protein|nr:hypothetical protein [Treponema sp.]